MPPRPVVDFDFLWDFDFVDCPEIVEPPCDIHWEASPQLGGQEGEDIVDLWFELVDAGYTEDEAFDLVEMVMGDDMRYACPNDRIRYACPNDRTTSQSSCSSPDDPVFFSVSTPRNKAY